MKERLFTLISVILTLVPMIVVSIEYKVTVTLRNSTETKNFVLFDNDAYSIAMLTALGDDIGAALGAEHLLPWDAVEFPLA